MFFSLNKRFIYTIVTFFLFSAGLFIYTFYTIYGEKINLEQKTAFARNQQFIELLYNNINLRMELSRIVKNNPDIKLNEITQQIINNNTSPADQETLTREQKHAAETTQNYSEKYQALQEAVKIVIGSSILMLLSILLLWLLIRRWVVVPINRFSTVSNLVSSGILSSRIKEHKNKKIYDEFSLLAFTFNNMLDNLENNIKEIKNKEIFLQSLIDIIPDGIRVINETNQTIMTNKEYQRQIKNIKTSKNSILKQHLAVNSAKLISDNKIFIVESIRDLSEDINFMHQQKLSTIGFLGTSIAHEMKNYLGSIHIIVETLLNKHFKNISESNEVKKYLLLINKEIVECLQIPEILLKMAHFSTEKKSKINCLQSIKEIITLLDYEAKKNGISIHVKAEDNNISIRGTEIDFKIIIMNLAQNAFNAMPNNGTLNFKISKNNKQTIIKVCDTGKGISQNKIKKIFEPFYSDGSSSKTKNKSSTGLGLSIVKLIVEKFNGSIAVESKKNHGTCFTLTFPDYSKK